MKNKKELIKSIGTFLCVLMVCVTCVGVNTVYAGDYSSSTVCNKFHKYHSNVQEWYSVMPDYAVFPISTNGYQYQTVILCNYNLYCIYTDKPYTADVQVINGSTDGTSCLYTIYGNTSTDASNYEVYKCSSKDWITWKKVSKELYYWPPTLSFTEYVFNADGTGSLYTSFNDAHAYYYCNYDICCSNCGSVVLPKVVKWDYDSSLGYLQNVSRKSTYIRGALYNYDEDSLTYHWYHDLQSSSGVDLTSGEYKVRHYVSNATVKGYEKEDIVEMSDKYLMAEYDASQGYFSYLQKDYLDKLDVLGYEEIGFIDKYLKGYFTLQHHYFQIVNTSTNEVGGYLHFYPKDVSGDSFGVEMEFEGLDDNFDVVEDGPSGYIDTSTGSGETIEDALENADQPKLDDLGGIDPLIESLEGYASQVGNVTSGVGALLGALPPWVVGLLGLSVAMLFVVIVIKALRG